VEKRSTACYLLIGEAADPTIAERIALRYRDCPHVHFLAAFGRTLVGVYYLPEAQRWWIELVADQPQLTLGLSRAAVYRTERPVHPESFAPRIPDGLADMAPCGSDCRECERFDACTRCPATSRFFDPDAPPAEA